MRTARERLAAWLGLGALWLCGALAQVNELEGPNFGERAARPRGRPFDDWDLSCDRRRSIGGFQSRVYVSAAHGTDILVRAFCRSIAHRTDPILRVSERDCRTTVPFSLQTDNVTIDDDVHNCVDGEFVRSIYSDFDNGTRMMNFQCCRPYNAEIDLFVGCNTEGPIDLFETYHGFLKDPYDPRADCPRDALVGVKYESGGMWFKYCPFRIDARNYLALCPELKSTALLKSAGSAIGDGVDSLFRLDEDRWSGVHQSWRFECKGFKVLQRISVGFQFHSDEVRRDILFKFQCVNLMEQPQTAKKVRITAWTKISFEGEYIDEYGCRDHEALIGVASLFKQAEGKRFIALICAEHCNADIEECLHRDEAKVLKWGEVVEALAEDPERIHNIGMVLEGVERVSMLTVYGQYKYVIESKCDVSTRTDENTGETIDPWVAEFDIDLLPGDLPRVRPGDWTQAAQSWRVECQDFEVVERVGAKLEDEDVVIKLECTTMVKEEQEAKLVRFTQWYEYDAVAKERGCRDNEALRGLMSYFHPEDEIRFFSLICMEGSNADVSGDLDEVSNQLSESEYEFAASDSGFVVKNLFTAAETMTVTLVSYKYVSEAKFTESILINEIEGVSSPLLDVNVDDLDALSGGDWSATEESFKFECGGFDAVQSAWVRGHVLDDGSDDLEFKFECATAVEGAQTATKARWSGWMEQHQMKIKLGCHGSEILQGIGAYYHPEKMTRYFAFLCTEGSNAAVSEGPRVMTFTAREGVENGTRMNGTLEDMEMMQNILASGFVYRKVQTKFNVYLIRLKFVEEAAFTESSKVNEATGEIEDVITIDVGGGADGEGGLPMLEPTEWSESGQDFTFECPPGEAVLKQWVRVVPWEENDGQWDVIFKFTCEALPVPPAAYRLRVTKWEFIRTFEATSGCREGEALAGFNTFIHKERGTRFISLICLEPANAVVELTEGPVNYTLSKSKTEISSADGLHLQTFYTELDEQEVMSIVVAFVRFSATEQTAFSECERINDVSGERTPIADCPSGADGGAGGADGDGAAGCDGETGEGFCALTAPCPSWWNFKADCPKLYGCFKAFHIGQMTWHDAQEYCEERHGARLAQFETHAKWAHMKEHLSNNGKRFWMGLHRPDGIGMFPQWFDGSPVDFEPWMPTSPFTENFREACGLIRNGEWYDSVCHSDWNEGFVCEIP